MDSYERYVLREKARHAWVAEKSARPTRGLAGWVCANSSLLNLPRQKLDAEDLITDVGRVDRNDWIVLEAAFASLRQPLPSPCASGLEQRLRWLCETLQLKPLDGALLKVCVRVAIHDQAAKLAELVDGGSGGEINAVGLATLSGHGRRVLRAILPGSPLLMLGLMEDRHGGDFAPSSTVMRIARQRTTDPARLRQVLVDRKQKASLSWNDFDHLRADADRVERLILSCIQKRATGVNVLLYGDPGTGKTEFVRTLAKRIDAQAVFIGEADDENNEPTRADRISAFAITRALAGHAGQTLLVVDEADDIFTGVDDGETSNRVGSKVFMNRLVETTTAPTIWITNHPERLGSAVLRRMALAIRFPQPTKPVRRRMIEQIARRRKTRLSAEGLNTLATIDASPAIMDNALRVGQLTGGGHADSAAAAQSVLRAMTGCLRPADPLPVIPFDPALSCADQDLRKLAERVAASGQMAVSFCLYGLSGTGKSAFARHVAELMGLEVMQKRASDLLSMWVGESEKQIAAAFEAAADSRAMLIIDEADSLLCDRAGARSSWEVSHVNEMLTWMERHPYPFACTTNLMDSLDPASLRRFLFKVKFLPMTSIQARAAFERHFDCDAPRDLDNLKSLAPGDFTVVARKATLLGVTQPSALTAMLAAEVAVKLGGRSMKIGF